MIEPDANFEHSTIMSTAVKLFRWGIAARIIYIGGMPSLIGEESWTGFADAHVRPTLCCSKSSAQMDVTSH